MVPPRAPLEIIFKMPLRALHGKSAFKIQYYPRWTVSAANDRGLSPQKFCSTAGTYLPKGCGGGVRTGCAIAFSPWRQWDPGYPARGAP